MRRLRQLGKTSDAVNLERFASLSHPVLRDAQLTIVPCIVAVYCIYNIEKA